MGYAEPGMMARGNPVLSSPRGATRVVSGTILCLYTFVVILSFGNWLDMYLDFNIVQRLGHEGIPQALGSNTGPP